MNKVLKFIMNPGRKAKHISVAIIAFSLVVNTFLVYITGGIPSAFAHTMYLTVLIAAIFLGPWGAAITGLIAGLLIGPLMTYVLLPGHGEELSSSLYRAFYFVLMGIISGDLLLFLKRQLATLHLHHTHDLLTNIPNVNYYLEAKQDNENSNPFVALTLQINNHEELIVLIGNEAYGAILAKMHQLICNFLSPNVYVVFVDERRFWIELSHEEYHHVIEPFMAYLEQMNLVSGTIPLYIDYSIGVSLTGNQDDIVGRFHESDVASMHAKIHSLKHVIYNQSHEKDQSSFILLGELPQAIKENQLFMTYQPIVDLKTNTCKGMEALVRWQHKNHTLFPGEFIPLAEKTRLINQITEWVCMKVIFDYKTYDFAGSNFEISVNISQRNLYEPVLIESIVDKIKMATLPDYAIEVEITESTLMLNKQAAENILKAMSLEKISIVLDDFGNEYSSLAYLRDLPIKKIKIDRGFTMNIVNNNNTRILVKAIIDLAHDMGYTVVAEGIETKEILNTLLEMGCDYGQGYYFARPMRPSDISSWMERNSKK